MHAELNGGNPSSPPRTPAGEGSLLALHPAKTWRSLRKGVVSEYQWATRSLPHSRWLVLLFSCCCLFILATCIFPVLRQCLYILVVAAQ